MLVLNRAKEERIIIGGNIIVQVLSVRKGVVKLGIDAPKDVLIHREELAKKIAEEQNAEHLADPDCD
jgi:carbon storage regulator